MPGTKEAPSGVWLPFEVAEAMADDAPPDNGDIKYIRLDLLDAAVEQARREVWEAAIKAAHCSLDAGSGGSGEYVNGFANGVISGCQQTIAALEAAQKAGR